MERRKLKLNVLDVTIIALLICAVVALVFRGTVKELFDKPENVKLNLVLVTDKTNPDAIEMFALHNTVYVDGNTQLQSAVIETEETETDLVVTLECKGYKKLGRFYTEHGDLLSGVSKCTVQYKETRAECAIQSVNLAE